MDADAPKLTALAQQLAAQYPNSIFRTGNATGSDEAFAKGISQVDATRLEYVLPSSGMGKVKRLIPNTRVISLEDLSKEELNHFIRNTRSYSQLPIPGRLPERYKKPTCRKCQADTRCTESLWF